MADLNSLNNHYQHHIGIDLGTTNCALAHVVAGNDAVSGPIEILQIPQVIRPGEMGSRPLLPSFTY